MCRLTLGGAPPYPRRAARSGRWESGVSQTASIEHPVVRITIRLKVGEHRLSATDDPVFLGFHGRSGRQFRLALARGRSLRRGREDRYVLGAPDDPETNVAHAELNDPTQPPLDAAAIDRCYLRKGFDPIPNVRGVGEMDDRLEVAEIEIEIHGEGMPKAVRFAREGPLWLGLLSGLQFEIPRVDEGP